MTTELFEQLTDMPAEDLRPIVSQVIDAEANAIDLWSVTEIGRSAGKATAGIFRLAGSASTDAGEQPWSVVAKVLGPPRLQGREYKPVDAERELSFYRSGAFSSQQDRVRSPRCYAIERWNDLDIIWLEDLSAAPQTPWIPAYYIQAAQHVGSFNGRGSEPGLPDWTWLSSDGLQKKYRSQNKAQVFGKLPALQQVPVAGRTLPSHLVQSLLKLWQSGDELFAKIGETSKCLCHRDYHPKNLFPMPDAGEGSYTVAIDWDQAGIEHPGSDIGLLLSSPIKWMELSFDEAAALVDPIFNAYLTGLAEAGWSGNQDQVRLTYLACLGTGEAMSVTRLTGMIIEHPEMRASVERLMQHSVEQVFDHWVETLEFCLAYHERALELARRL